jgi:hypothetical protein
MWFGEHGVFSSRRKLAATIAWIQMTLMHSTKRKGLWDDSTATRLRSTVVANSVLPTGAPMAHKRNHQTCLKSSSDGGLIDMEKEQHVGYRLLVCLCCGIGDLWRMLFTADERGSHGSMLCSLCSSIDLQLWSATSLRSKRIFDCVHRMGRDK